jgi:hypothetical protein
MRVSILPTLLFLSVFATIGHAVSNQEAELKSLLSRTTRDIFARLQDEEAALAKRGIEPSCTTKNIAIRKEL